MTPLSVRLRASGVFAYIRLNPLTAGAAYIRIFILFQHIEYHILNMSKIQCNINQQYLERVDLHFPKSE